MINILLASNSHIKIVSVKNYFQKNLKSNKQINIKSVHCDKVKLPNQPLDDSVKYCSFARLEYVKSICDTCKFDYIISIENGIDTKTASDYCFVIIQYRNLFAYGESFKVEFGQELLDELSKKTTITNINKNIYGFDKTLGSLLHDKDSTIKSNNWIKKFSKFDRFQQIYDGIFNAMYQLTTLRDQRRIFVKYHTNNKIISETVLEFAFLIKMLKNKYLYQNVDYIIGMENKGFSVASKLAEVLGATFVPLNKNGKIICEEKVFDTEIIKYIKPNTNIVIIDDTNDNDNLKILETIIDTLEKQNEQKYNLLDSFSIKLPAAAA